MNWIDWVISLGLIVLVLRQIRGKPLTPVGLLWPVGLVVWAGFEYLGGIPGFRSDWIFTLCLAAVGVGLGLGCGSLTRVTHDDQHVMAKASAGAAALWIVGMGSRLAFGFVALNGGAEAIGRLSEHLDLHSQDTWPTALILMALCEVVCRTAVLLVKYRTQARRLRADSSLGIAPQAGRR